MGNPVGPTFEKIITHPSSKEYREGWDRIFGTNEVGNPKLMTNPHRMAERNGVMRLCSWCGKWLENGDFEFSECNLAEATPASPSRYEGDDKQPSTLS